MSAQSKPNTTTNIPTWEGAFACGICFLHYSSHISHTAMLIQQWRKIWPLANQYSHLQRKLLIFSLHKITERLFSTHYIYHQNLVMFMFYSTCPVNAFFLLGLFNFIMRRPFWNVTSNPSTICVAILLILNYFARNYHL